MAGLRVAMTLALAMSFSSLALAGNWPGWRGPAGVGTTDETDLPLTWDGKKGENVLWKVPLKGTTGHSSPIVWGDRVFITTAARQTGEQEKNKEIPDHHLACYQVSDGTLVWKTPIPQGKEQMGYAIYAVPTPVTDGKMIYCWFGSAVIAAVDWDGKLVWRQERPGPFNLNPGICSSLALHDDLVYLLVDGARGLGYLQALDKKTGEVKWEKKRDKMGHNNSSPILLPIGGKPQLILAGSNVLQGLDPATGEPIWWSKSVGFGQTPAYGSGLLYADRGGNELAVCVDPTGKGDVTQTNVKWQNKKSPGDYSSPVIAGEFIYKYHKESTVGCYKLATGELLYTAELKDVSKLASPFATADGRIYFMSTGKSYVLKAGPTLEIIGGGNLGGWGNGSSPAVSAGRIFVRDFDFLWCIGKK